MNERDGGQVGNFRGLAEGDLAAAERLRQGFDALREQMARVIVGQDEVIEQLIISLFTGTDSQCSFWVNFLGWRRTPVEWKGCSGPCRRRWN